MQGEKMSAQAVAELTKNYGPFAFSFVVFFAMWAYVVQPEMERREVEWGSHREVLASERELLKLLQEQTQSQKATAEVMKETAAVLHETSKTLHVLCGNLEVANGINP